MKLSFVSNFFNHHQQHISNALYRLLDGGYNFIQTESVPDERKKLGYRSDFSEGYILDCSVDGLDKAQAHIDDADVVVIGSAPECLIKQRIKNKRLIFRYSERPLRNGIEPLKYPFRFLRWNFRNPPHAPIYMLCASAFSSSDYAKMGLFRNRAYKWGYFPETRHYDVESLLHSKDTTRILWCGRFIDWKHVEHALSLADRLKKNGYVFAMDIIGTGDQEDMIKDIIKRDGLSDCVRLMGSMPYEQVRTYMEKSGIYLFTSDRQEGWGAVLNEAMNSACAVVASHSIGAVPYLIDDEKNGLVYRFGDEDMLYKRVTALLDDPMRQKQLGESAYKTIVDEWNAETAAERLLTLSARILAGDKNPCLYESGPCSRAQHIRDDWYK